MESSNTPKTQDPRPKTQDPRPKTEDRRPKTQGYEYDCCRRNRFATEGEKSNPEPGRHSTSCAICLALRRAIDRLHCPGLHRCAEHIDSANVGRRGAECRQLR